MKYPIADLTDRYTIELLKFHRVQADNTGIILEMRNEIHRRFDYHDLSQIDRLAYVNELYKKNGEIWDLESDIRKGLDDELGLEEIGRRAIEIREKNKERIGIKNKIAELFGEYIEQKFNHISS